jgi:hypothetical protein
MKNAYINTRQNTRAPVSRHWFAGVVLQLEPAYNGLQAAVGTTPPRIVELVLEIVIVVVQPINQVQLATKTCGRRVSHTDKYC